MKKPKRLPPVELLRECFIYNPDIGELKWKVRPRKHFRTYKGWAVWNANNAEMRAGNITNTGYRRVLINAISYQEHRIIWKLMTSIEPRQTIDHVDGIRSNNKWSNLRTATHREQKWNSKLRRDNRSGHRGVFLAAGRWLARINIDGKYRHLGSFDTSNEAIVAYQAVARKLHGEFFREHG